MKKLMAVLIAFFAMSVFGLVACTVVPPVSTDSPSNNEPTNQLSVELSENALTLDRYEEELLTATVVDEQGNAVEEQVVWESDNLSVVTVENGFVVATGVGSANVTASVGEVSATCVVTVEDSGALPVLNVSDESFELVVGGSYSVDANVTYKREVIEAATITYEMLDTTVASVDENGNVTALKFGTTTLKVVATWKDIDSAYFTQEISVTVKEDVVVEIEADEAVEIFTSNIEVDGTQFANTATLTSKVLISGSADGVDQSRISWASSDEDVLTVENGVITAVSEGYANLTVSYTTDSKTYTSTALQVKVSFPVVEKNLKVDLDVSKATIGEQITANEVFGNANVAITKIYTVDDSADISADTAWLAEHDFGTEQERTYTLIVANADYGYAINALVVTKLISTYTDLQNIHKYGNVKDVVHGTKTFKDYSGYFVLTNNIIAPADAAVINTQSTGKCDGAVDINNALGFHGTFDGQGYSLVNFKFGAGGLFGNVAKDGIVKNLAVVNATITEEDQANAGAGILSFGFAGKAQNIFVSFTTEKARTGVFGRYLSGATISDLVVHYTKKSGYGEGAIVSWVQSSSTFTNCTVIYSSSNSVADNKLADTGNVVATTLLETEIASATFTGFNTDLWFVEEGYMPIFKSAVKGIEISETSLEVDANAEVTLVATFNDIAGNAIPTYSATWESSDDEIATVENGAITFEALGNVTITATIGSYSATCVIEITEAQIEVEDKTTKTLTVEAKGEKGLAEQLMAEGVKAGLFESFNVASITDVAGAELAENYLATADANNARNATLIVYGVNKGYKVNVFVVTKVITTAEELTKLQEYAGFTTVDASYSATYTATYYNYGGYFVLGNDIIVKDTDAVISANCLEQIASGTQIKVENGFSGVFDGRGHSIVNAKFGAGGLLGDVANTGVIKNIAFVNATITEEAKSNAGAGVVAYSFYGSAENVFVSYTTLKARNGAFGRVTKDGSLKNVVVYYKKSGGYNGGALAGWNLTQMKTENVYVVYANGMAVEDCKVTGDQTANYSNAVVEIQESEVANATFSGLDTDLWFVEEGYMPIFKSAVKEFVLSETEITVDINGEVVLTATFNDIAGNAIPTYSATWESSDDEIATVENGALTILTAGKITITATIGDYSATCTVIIAAAEREVLDKTATTLTVEAKGEKGLAEQLVAAGVAAGLFDSFDVVSITDANGEAVEENFIANADANNARNATLIVYGINNGYKVKVLVVTKIITTAQQLVDILDYANNVTEISVTYNNVERKTYSYHGYFVLGNNITQDANSPITFAGPSIGTANNQKVINISSGYLVTKNGSEGFHGTFDGQGYSIDGFSYGVGGVFGFIGSGAVIKNVAFTNCATGDNISDTRNESVLAQGAIGSSNDKWLIDNVYVQGTMNGLLSGMLVGYWANDGTISNTVVQVKFTGGCDRIGSISYEKNNGFAVDNFVGVYEYDSSRGGRDYKPFGYASVHTAPASWSFAEYELRDGALRKITAKTYNGNELVTNTGYTLAESAPTAEEFAGFSSTYWTVEAGKAPVFKAKN